MQFRKLTKDEIDCRISTVSAKGLSLLLYKDARVDMRILDETVGAENWKRSHELINGNLFCNVSIKCGGEWVTKQDVGVESYTEKEKGQASDSFKRACFNWGIGRELYSAPFIWIGAQNCNLYEKNGKYSCNDRFSVTAIEYDERGDISQLAIRNDKNGMTVFTYGQKGKQKTRTGMMKEVTQLMAAKGYPVTQKATEQLEAMDDAALTHYLEQLKLMPEKKGEKK